MRLHSSFLAAAPALCGHFLSQSLKGTLNPDVWSFLSAAVLPQVLHMRKWPVSPDPALWSDRWGQSHLTLVFEGKIRKKASCTQTQLLVWSTAPTSPLPKAWVVRYHQAPSTAFKLSEVRQALIPEVSQRGAPSKLLHLQELYLFALACVPHQHTPNCPGYAELQRS